MTPARRQLLLFGLLGLSAAAVIWDRQRARPVTISGAVVRTQTASATAALSTQAPEAQTTVGTLRPRSDYLASGGDAFPSTQASPPKLSVGPATVAEPPRPSAPALPFTVIGKKLERGVWEIYLARGEQTYIATQGATIADDYRVNAIGPTQMTLTYLPLNEQQTLQTGASLHD